MIPDGQEAGTGSEENFTVTKMVAEDNVFLADSPAVGEVGAAQKSAGTRRVVMVRWEGVVYINGRARRHGFGGQIQIVARKQYPLAATAQGSGIGDMRGK